MLDAEKPSIALGSLLVLRASDFLEDTQL